MNELSVLVCIPLFPPNSFLRAFHAVNWAGWQPCRLKFSFKPQSRQSHKAASGQALPTVTWKNPPEQQPELHTRTCLWAITAPFLVARQWHPSCQLGAYGLIFLLRPALPGENRFILCGPFRPYFPVWSCVHMQL